MRLRALLDTEALGLRLIGGEEELDRTVQGVMTTDLKDPGRYIKGGELVLTGLAWWHGPEDLAELEPFVRVLAEHGVSALAVGEAELSRIPDGMVETCARYRLPLFAVDESVAFATITERVLRQISGERAGDLAAVVDRHRRMMSSGPEGGGADAVLELLRNDLDLRAWVLSPTGRIIAGPTTTAPGPAGSTPTERTEGTEGTGRTKGTERTEPAAEAPAPAGTAPTGPAPADSTAGAPSPAPGLTAHLAAEHLAAARAGRQAPWRVTTGRTTYSLFPVRGTGHGPRLSRQERGTLLSDWVLAVEADAAEWPAERLDLVHGVTQLVAVERDRRDAARTVRRRLAQEIVELVQAGAAPAEIAARLRVAAPVLLPGLGAAPHWQMVVAQLEQEGTDAPTGPVTQALLEEILIDPLTAGTEYSDRIAVAHTGEEAVALVPLPAVSTEHDGSESGIQADALLTAVREPLAAGLGDDGRLTVGVSATVHSAEGLRGALEEARHARRVAAARPGLVCAAGHQELASHVLLLPFVPDDVRRAFTARLLDPLREYDRRHRAELIPTLEAFLEADGSWTRCAGQLHLHVNTLRYRVGRIEQLTGRDLSRLEDKLDFFLALRMS
jgi:Purine catabolism regulatory protein-like family/PucR C-terminal helix-turn-helix domain/GGDEF-like domain